MYELEGKYLPVKAKEVIDRLDAIIQAAPHLKELTLYKGDYELLRKSIKESITDTYSYKGRKLKIYKR